MNKFYFKVYVDFTRYIPIDETELEKALYAFQIGKPVIFENGAATRIESIIPDYNKANGWYSDYKPKDDDFAYIDQMKPKYVGYIGQIKEKIQYLLKTNQSNLIGQNVEVPELNQPKINPVSEMTKKLAEGFKVTK